jgi:hypothetical protein
MTARCDGRVKPALRLFLRPLLLIVAFPALHVVLRATPAGPDIGYVLLVMPSIFLAWVATGLVGAFLAVEAWQRRDWPRFVSWLSVALAIGAGAAGHNYVRAYTNIAGDTLNFLARLPYYLEWISKEPRDGTPRLLVFNRGGMIWASNGVVYDESDEVALPRGRQSAAWQARADRTELGCGDFYITPLLGHFYLADFPC